MSNKTDYEANNTGANSSHMLNASQLRTLWLASLGGALEFYDFVIFVFFTPIISRLFFSLGLPEWVRELETFAIFAVGYVVRPVGGIIMAHFGDTKGRKQVFTLSIFMMAIPTLSIGLMPTYQSIGIAAPLILLLMRSLQGMAIGGEAPGGWVFVAEHVAERRIGLAIGLLTSGLTLGIFLGSLVTTILNVLFPVEQIASVLWRAPFVLGGLMGMCGLLLRRGLQETPVFEQMRSDVRFRREMPLRLVLRRYPRQIVVSMAATLTLTAAIVVVILMTPSILERSAHLAPPMVQIANLAGTGALAISTVIFGCAVDRYGLRRVVAPALVLLVAGAYGIYFAAHHSQQLLLPFYIAAGFGAGAVVLTPAAMVQVFPSPVRFTGVSLSYNLAYALFGGLTPPFVAWIAHVTVYGPAHYIALTAVIGLIALLAASQMKGHGVQQS
jgi:MFS family permease